MTRDSRGIFVAVAGLAFAAYGALLARNISFAVGGSDSSGYANAAKLLSEGKVLARIEALDRFDLPDRFLHAFLPLAFVPGPEPRTMAPFYPVGMSLHMAAAGLLAGWGLGPFLVSPLAALGCLVLTFLLGREVGLPRSASLGAAGILGACAVFLYQALQPMSDVVATFWCAAAVLAALYARRRPAWAAAAGVAFGIAVLVRPTAALLLPALLLALPTRGRSFLLFIAGGLPVAALLLVYNGAAYGGPFKTGYVETGQLGGFALRHFPARFSHYVGWLVRMLSPLVPLGWAALPFLRRVPLRDRALLFWWFAAFFLLSCFYLPYETWWYTRFLLPGLPALILGALLAARETISRLTAEARPRQVIAALFAGSALAVAADRTDDLHVFNVDEGQAVIPVSCAWAAEVAPAKALVASVELSGALRYYADLMPVRSDWLDPDSFAELRARTEAAGGRWYALFFSHEVREAASRIPGNWTFLGQRGPIGLWRLDP